MILIYFFSFFFHTKQNADQVERLNESGELRQMLKIYKVSKYNHRMLIYLAGKKK